MFRTRTVPEIFGASFRLLRGHFRTLIVISAVYTGLPALVQDSLQDLQGPDPSASFMLGSFLVILFVPSFLGSIAVAHVLYESALGRGVAVQQAVIYPLRMTAGVSAGLLVGVMILGGLFAFVLPGLYLLVAYTILAPVVAVEDPTIPVAFMRAWKLLDERRSAALTITFVILIPTMLSTAADAYLGEAFTLRRVVDPVLSIFLSILTDIAAFLLYVDCRLRKEDWNPDGEAPVLEGASVDSLT